MTFLQNGVDNIDWWDLHNGPGSTSTKLADGSTDYGDGGILSSGGCTGSASASPRRTRRSPRTTACRRFPDSPRPAPR